MPWFSRRTRGALHLERSGAQARSINDAGQVVGGFTDRFGKPRFFLWDGSTYTTLSLPQPGAVTGINDAGLVVGFFSDDDGWHGYLSDGATHTLFDVPGPAARPPAAGVRPVLGWFTRGCS